MNFGQAIEATPRPQELHDLRLADVLQVARCLEPWLLTAARKAEETGQPLQIEGHHAFSILNVLAFVQTLPMYKDSGH